MAILLVVQLVLVALLFAHAWLDLLTAPRMARGDADRSPMRRLSVIVPARDEEHNIDACLRSLVAQDHDDLEIVVVDDGSTDRTAEIVASYAERDPRVVLHPCPPRPEGWQGKSWALHQGVGATTGEWIAMIDADVALSPRALRRALALANRRGVVLLSVLPSLRDVTFWEKVIQPVMGLFVFIFQPLWLASSPNKNVVVANGQFLLVLREPYLAVGGHASVKRAIVEDVELARVYKDKGLPLALVPAFEDVNVRMYTGLGGIWRGWGKTIHPYLSERPVSVWAGFAVLLGLFLAPFVLLPVAIAKGPWSVEAIACVVAISLIFVNALAFRSVSRHELLHGLLWPLALVVIAGLFVARTHAVVVGAGVEWKGRRYR